MRVQFIFTCFFLSFSLFSQEQPSLDIDINTAINSALQANYDLKKENLTFFDKKLTFYNSWNNFIPDAAMSLTMSNQVYNSTTDAASSSTSGTSKSSSGSNTRSASFGISIAQPVEVKTFFNVYQNYLDYKDGKLTLDKVQKGLVRDVKKNYYNLILLAKEIAIKRVSLNNAKERYDQAVIQFRDGEISEVEKLNRELTYKTIIPELSKLETNYTSVFQQFKQTIGLPLEKEVTLTSSIPAIGSLTKLNLTSGLEQNIDLSALKIKKDRDQNSRNIAIAQFVPTFRFTYSVSSSFQKDPFNNDWFADPANDWKATGTIGLSFSLPLDPLLPFSSEVNALIKAQNTLTRTNLDLKKETEKKQIELSTIQSKLDQINASYQTLKLNAEIAGKIYKLTFNEFREGTKNSSDVKEAEKNKMDAELKMESIQFDYVSLVLDLEYLLNIQIL